MSEKVIQINNLKKEYQLGVIGGKTLREELQSWWARKRGKVDPNTKIGSETINYGEKFLALDDISITVNKGEALGIIGSNGAGKSTLLKILSRVTAPTEGSIFIKGRIASMLEVGTGFHGELTGRENIYMNGAILGMTKREVDSKIDDIIEFSECRKFIDTPVKRYSSGMYVKLAFAVAAHLDAEIMVMDEVLAVGDMKFQEKCLGKMENAANREGKTVLYVSHNMSTIRQLCTRCIVLSQGKIVFDGDVETAIGEYLSREKGTLQTFYELMNEARPTIDHGMNIKVSSFEFINKEIASYWNDEKIFFKIIWTCVENIKGLRLYFTINHESDTVVGTTMSDVFTDLGNQNIFESIFEYDASNLAEGTYYFYVDIFTMNENGIGTSLDHPNKKIYFEIKNKPERLIINPWQRKYFGSIQLNEIKKASI